MYGRLLSLILFLLLSPAALNSIQETTLWLNSSRRYAYEMNNNKIK